MRQTQIGWREWVALPDLGVSAIKAKVDTGARSSALHAYRLHVDTGENGVQYASFEIHPLQRSSTPSLPVRVPIAEWRRVRSSDGRQQLRPVISTRVTIAGRTVRTEITLARRDEMGFRMLLGRTTLRRRFLIDPGRSFLGGKP